MKGSQQGSRHCTTGRSCARSSACTTTWCRWAWSPSATRPRIDSRPRYGVAAAPSTSRSASHNQVVVCVLGHQLPKPHPTGFGDVRGDRGDGGVEARDELFDTLGLELLGDLAQVDALFGQAFELVLRLAGGSADAVLDDSVVTHRVKRHLGHGVHRVWPGELLDVQHVA